MASSKRAAARNEKILQDLVQGQTCADCQARNPAWASWSLGVFLCMRCAAIHRKLGTHISKVKSLSMDSWSNEQVDNMRKVGNATSNKIYNPQNKKPPVPVDADEVDSAMERFIRQKYMNNSVSGARRHNTGSTESDETPPPLPPKTPSRFGFRSASSIFPLSSKAKKEVSSSSGRRPTSSRDNQDRNDPDSPRNKASKVFGASVQYESADETEVKLARLRDMGFLDDQRNSMVLRGMGGNIEKTVEALVRLGEGDGRPVRLATSPREPVAPIQRSATPTSTLSVPQHGRAQSPASPSRSNNPFDMLDMAPARPQSSQSTGTLQTKNPYNSQTNPFSIPPQQGLALDQALQNMSLSPSQPLFPHHTGGLPGATPGQLQMGMQQQQHLQQQQQQPFYTAYPQQMVSPHTSSMAQNMMFTGNQAFSSPPVQQPMLTANNPFFANAPVPQQPTPQVPLTVNTATPSLAQYGSNPFLAKSPTRVQSPSMLAQIPEQGQQQDFYASPAPLQQPWSAPVSALPYGTPLSATPQNNPFYAPAQPLVQPQAPPRADTASIMALFNTPQSSTNPFQPQLAGQSPSPASTPNPPLQGQLAAPQQHQQHQQAQLQTQNLAVHSAAGILANPLASGNKNPFLSLGGGGTVDATAGTGFGGARSRDSVLAQGLEWSNGRHSPDAFASLSARDVR
ncbi:hypothetical protein MAPG_07660 [Magnaporthiopsis poae ATCC 64411]|uniref:UBA domain-containing protein 3 n=1 Tax=Magnaporthiopsis poae (strain ATCC 64411 / 73-15) TaxID=644358 RepID=A0A0C4E594_MAGP6|nr:hypothetical protein MAPG_07660 [Magnaporthiopsis poae ATCC 64411]